MTMIDDIRRDKEAGTPGPWKVDADSDVVTGPLGYMVADLLVLDNNPTDADIANARRIARVPDMEDALLAAESEKDRLRARVAALEQTVDGIWRYAVDETVLDAHFRGWAEVEARAAMTELDT